MIELYRTGGRRGVFYFTGKFTDNYTVDLYKLGNRYETIVALVFDEDTV